MQASGDTQPKEIAPNVWRVLDPTHGRFYYYNRSTGETSWTPPPGVVDPPAPQAPPAHSGSPSKFPGNAGFGGSGGGYSDGRGHDRRSPDYGGRDRRDYDRRSPGFGGSGGGGGAMRDTNPDQAAPEPHHGLEIDHREVTLKGVRVTPWDQWGQCTFPPQLLSALTGAGFPHPSPIQAYAWPILTQVDMHGAARGGS